MSLVINYQASKRLDVDDFSKHTSLADLKSNSPKISIYDTISKGTNEESDDLVTMSISILN